MISKKEKGKSKKYKAVIFDLGDVYYRNGFKTVLSILSKKKKIPKKFLEEVFQRSYVKKIETDKISEREFWKEFEEDTGLKIDPPKIRKAVFEYFKPIPGMREVVRACQKKAKVGLLTNNIKGWFKFQEKKENFHKIFDAVVISANVGLRKPGREIFLLMAKKLNAKPSECIFFDDLEDNVKGAKKVKMKAFQFKSAKDCAKKLNHLGVLESKKTVYRQAGKKSLRTPVG